MTKYRTYKEDTLSDSKFEDYIKRYYDSWVAFARHKGYGDDVQPVLVSGFDMTRDFAMVAYSNESASGESDLTIAVPMVASASASVWGTWHSRCSPHTNYGPQECSPPTSERLIDFPSEPSQTTEAPRIPNEFNQCVFIRYYTIRKLLRLFPMVIRAAAGPHDLGPGDDTGTTFPELMAQLNIEDTDDADLEPNSVTHNTPSVWPLLHNFVSALITLSGKGLRQLACCRRLCVPGIFNLCVTEHGAGSISRQNNSNATSVLMHHRDLEGVYLVSYPNVVDSGSSPLCRMVRTTSLPYWLRIDHTSLWTRAEVSSAVIGRPGPDFSSGEDHL